MNLEPYIKPMFKDMERFSSRHEIDGLEEIATSAGNILLVPAETFRFMAREAFRRMAFGFSPEHLERLIRAASDKQASRNDRAVAAMMLKNAAIAAKGEFPLCQDSGVAHIIGWKSQRTAAVLRAQDGSALFADERRFLDEGVAAAYTEFPLRSSVNVPVSMFSEKDSGNNLPAYTELYTVNGEAEYRFYFAAKGGGSSNKTTLIQATRAILNENALYAALKKHITALGTSACPPYTITVAIGGLSPEQNLTAAKLAGIGAFDSAPSEDEAEGALLFRCPQWEKRALEIAENTGFGAQFGGKYMAFQARVLRLPRHGASCPVSISVSCSAHRTLRALVNSCGLFIERTVENPEAAPGYGTAVGAPLLLSKKNAVIDLDKGAAEAIRVLGSFAPGERVFLNGEIIVARDKAHALWKEQIDQGGAAPDYLTDRAICYAGPAKTPPNAVIGGFGPTTASRMDDYAETLMSRGVSLITLAKGGRSPDYARLCEKYNGFYLALPGGVAALIASEYIIGARIIDYEDLGMEAVRKIRVRRLPAFIAVDNKGRDFYARLRGESEPAQTRKAR